jgi:hypothetical protein
MCLVNSKGISRRYVTFGIIGFMDFVDSLAFETEHNVSETGFVPVLRWKGEEASTQLGPLVGANLCYSSNVRRMRSSTTSEPVSSEQTVACRRCFVSVYSSDILNIIC